MLRYWFLYGNYDSWYGCLDRPPITVGKGYEAYMAGQRAGLAGRFYSSYWPR